MTFGTQLRDLRRSRGLSMKLLAARAGIHPAQLSRFERGLRPSLDAIGRLARALDVPPAGLADAAIGDLPEDEAVPVEAVRQRP